MRKTTVYVAGPYTNPDPIENTQKAIAVAEELLMAGFHPIVPHVTMVWHLIKPHPIDFWYEYDLDTMRLCDVVFRFPGESTGADGEVAVARNEGIPVVYTMRELLTAPLTADEAYRLYNGGNGDILVNDLEYWRIVQFGMKQLIPSHVPNRLFGRRITRVDYT